MQLDFALSALIKIVFLSGILIPPLFTIDKYYYGKRSELINSQEKTDIWLLGQIISNLNQNKLPIIGHSLRLLFNHHHVINKATLKESIKLTI